MTHIPAYAPFSVDQRVWLAGFLAGIKAAAPRASATAAPTQTLDILYGSQTGNAEELAMTAASLATGSGLGARVAALDDVTIDALAAMQRVVVITSTYGEGEMPDNAELFWEALAADDAPRLESLSFAVLALGDSSYDGYCQAGKLIDLRLEQLGGTRVAERVDCDVDFEDDAAEWTTTVLTAFGGAGASPAATPKPTGWSRKNPYPSALVTNRRLSGATSAKEIRHLELELGDSGLEYAAGDALGVIPVNDPELVELLLAATGGGDAHRDAFTQNLEIVTPSRELIADVEQRAGDEELSHLLRSGDKDALAAWLWGRDVLDLVRLNPAGYSAAELATLLRPLQHRAYSISSSPLAHPGQVHLTVATVRYGTDGRSRGGVASTFLADRVGERGSARIFVSANTDFRPPADDAAPMIMVGPGTGVAPFRAFLEERRELGATGENWLFFGDQHRADDFIYEDELGEMSRDGTLNRLDLAFSRDQQEKVYVQSRMRDNGAELYDWLERGASFFVCGDASRMAKDVDRALHEVIAEHGGRSAEDAAAYVSTMKREKRYLRDVY